MTLAHFDIMFFRFSFMPATCQVNDPNTLWTGLRSHTARRLAVRRQAMQRPVRLFPVINTETKEKDSR